MICKRYFLLFLSLSLTSFVFAQKPPINIKDLGSWYFPYAPSISNNGKFVAYLISNKPKGQWTQVFKNIENEREHELVNVVTAQFTSDSKWSICRTIDNKIVVVNLHSLSDSVLGPATKYSVFAINNAEWLSYIKQDSNVFVLQNLSLSKNYSYFNVRDYVLSGNGKFIALKMFYGKDYLIKVVDLRSMQERIIYRGCEPNDLVFDEAGIQLAFWADIDMSAKLKSRSVWYYNSKDIDKAVKVDSLTGIDQNNIVSFERFSSKGDFVFCQLSNNVAPLEKDNNAKVKIWSYADPILKSYENSIRNERTHVGAIWYIRDKKIVQVYDRGELPFPASEKSHTQLIEKTVGHRGEWNWNKDAITSRSILNLSNGTKKLITKPDSRNVGYKLSASGRWIVYFDTESQSYWSYDVETEQRRCLTLGLDADWTTFDNNDIPLAKYQIVESPIFSSDETKVYLYDQHDIYEVSLLGKRNVINVTNGYGRKNNIVFRLAFSRDEWNKGKFLLTAFNRDTKEDGFFEVEKGNPKSLKELIMEPAIYSGPEESKYFDRTLPIKALDSDVYLVQRMTAESCTNIFVTKDFVRFKAVTDLHPEKNFNWLTTELINFSTLDGRKCQGILYKPENFDPHKKYPLIFYYYEKISECLNLYLKPDYCNGPINIPYFVSNGYLVFTPDIHFEIGYPGRSSFNTVMGATNKLIEYPFVDSTKLGLQGHSFGGFQTNYIIAHTNRYAAACSAAGFTNFVSAYGSIVGSGYSRQGQYELNRDRIGTTLWKRPDLYLENSPVMRLDLVNTPLLMMHNMKDEDVLVEQGIQFFTGLRRLGKVAYLLQYDDYGHLVSNEAAEDFTKRMKEFFDFYLKDAHLPSWMTTQKIQVMNFSPTGR